MTTGNKTNLQLSERVAKAIEKRDRVKDAAFQFQAEVNHSKKLVEESRVEAKTTYEVSTLQELLVKAQTIYKEDSASVDEFERLVDEFEKQVLEAERIKAEVNAQ